MKKIILFLIIVFNCLLSYSQINDYNQIKLRFYYDVDTGSRRICENICIVKVLYSDNTTSAPIINRGDRGFEVNINEIHKKKIKGIHLYAYAKRRNLRGQCRGDDETINRNLIFDEYCTSTYVNYQSESNNNATTIFGNFTIQILPYHFLKYPEKNTDSGPPLPITDLPSDDRITITNNENFGIDQYNYQYKFSTESDTEYKTIPSHLFNNHQLTISARDLFGDDWILHEGKEIYVRGVSCQKNSIYETKNNVVALTIIRSAPHIISENSIIYPTTCDYNSDGKIRIVLDRPLLNNEKIGYTLKRVSTSNETSYPADGSLVLDETNSFEIVNLSADAYTIKMIGGINGINTYTSGAQHSLNFTIAKPDPVDFTLSKVDVWCNGGKDGSLTINATGGNLLDASANGIRYYYSVNNGNWLPFSSESSHTLTNLSPGPYTVKVRDFKGCYAKTPQDTDKELTEIINQPLSPVTLLYTEVKQPTFYGGTNGQLVAAIKGGTRFADNSYAYEWKNSSGVLQTNVTPFYDATSGTYHLTLSGIPSDTYTLTIKDKNFDSATHQLGCTVTNSIQFLDQPDPIIVTLEVVRTISCNATNAFGNETDFNPTDGQRDESQDGILRATVTGGVPFTGFENNGLPYKFLWKKQQADGTWINWNDQDATAENLSHGNYSLNVEDKNKIRLGVYINNLLDHETPKIQFMQQPDKLELTFQKEDITCSAGNNGWVKAIPTGGTAPYNFEWTTGATTSQINNLIANNYFVKVIDAKGCFVQGSIIINQPNGVDITGTITHPTCHNGNDGSMLIDVAGGTQPYSYTWSSGQTTKDISNLAAGSYRLTLVDSKGCTYFKDFELENPNPIAIDLGSDRTLCNGQHLDLDISINDPLSQYIWSSTNGFTSSSPTVSLTNSGTYVAKIISSKGCTAQDTITISTNNTTIASEFLLTSQAYLEEEVILVNTSNPLGENTTWVIPDNVTIVSENEHFITLKFPSVGSYTISLKQTQGDCYALYSKTINVEAKTINPNIGNTSNPFISEFSVTPNPSNGDFNAIVKLEETSPIKIRLYALTGQQPLIEKYETGQKSYVVNFNVSLASGTYALILETAKQTLVKKIIIY